MNDFNLDKEPKIGTGFKTPEGYFDDFQLKMMQHLPVQEPKVIPLFARRRTWMMSAVAVLVLALMVPVYFNYTSNNGEIDAVSMENYLAYQSNISQYDLINLLDSEDIQSLDMDLALEDKTIEDILTTNNNFENYIYENE
ncbi:hypothetical protein J2X31_001121 [Flavobacterium arsenatis]|uniref:Uncharacterized protein n=1 Tax=Flavobacterium arsenatis TaxID=1484332 RepID=A0ABU1TMB9_9FLAO|nr:hypothetical protein [Flavobacterium arsenatis]MDR6967114.1 hypothetical protein [Flavobacterium arsenatis]